VPGSILLETINLILPNGDFEQRKGHYPFISNAPINRRTMQNPSFTTEDVLFSQHDVPLFFTLIFLAFSLC
jgi:hypothetical protein